MADVPIKPGGSVIAEVVMPDRKVVRLVLTREAAWRALPEQRGIAEDLVIQKMTEALPVLYGRWKRKRVASFQATVTSRSLDISIPSVWIKNEPESDFALIAKTVINKKAQKLLRQPDEFVVTVSGVGDLEDEGITVDFPAWYDEAVVDAVLADLDGRLPELARGFEEGFEGWHFRDDGLEYYAEVSGPGRLLVSYARLRGHVPTVEVS